MTSTANEIGTVLGQHFTESELDALANLLERASQHASDVADDLAYRLAECPADGVDPDAPGNAEQDAGKLAELGAAIRAGELQGREDHPVMTAGSSHASETFECFACGYSRFHYAEEFADGRPGDRTRICADCGHVEQRSPGVSVEPYRKPTYRSES